MLAAKKFNFLFCYYIKKSRNILKFRERERVNRLIQSKESK